MIWIKARIAQWRIKTNINSSQHGTVSLKWGGESLHSDAGVLRQRKMLFFNGDLIILDDIDSWSPASPKTTTRGQPDAPSTAWGFAKQINKILQIKCWNRKKHAESLRYVMHQLPTFDAKPNGLQTLDCAFCFAVKWLQRWTSSRCFCFTRLKSSTSAPMLQHLASSSWSLLSKPSWPKYFQPAWRDHSFKRLVKS